MTMNAFSNSLWLKYQIENRNQLLRGAVNSLHLIIRMNVRMHSYELRIDFFSPMRILLRRAQ